MARTLVIKTGDGLCGCGCGAELAKGRRYRQGHDAKLRGKLAAAARAGQEVAVGTNGSRVTKPAADWLREHGWPVPTVGDAAGQAKPKPKPKTRKASRVQRAPRPKGRSKAS
jgi:hypothetical protein